jgi:hypothetical protein
MPRIQKNPSKNPIFHRNPKQIKAQFIEKIFILKNQSERSISGLKNNYTCNGAENNSWLSQNTN